MDAKILEIGRTLQRILKQEKFFFNLTQYEITYKLIYSRKKWAVNAVGNKVVIGHTYHLTEKGKQFLGQIKTMCNQENIIL